MESKKAKKKDNTNCCVPQCNSAGYKDPNISFHRFPKVDSTCRRTTADGRTVFVNRRNEWRRILRIGREVSKRMSVCSKHFAPDAFTFPPERCKRARLKIFAVPSLFLPKTPSSPEENINLKTKNSYKKKKRFSQNLESSKCSTADIWHKNCQSPHASALNSNHQKENKPDLHSVSEVKIDVNEESYIYPLFVSHQQKEPVCRTSSQEQISPIIIENYTPGKMYSAIFSNEESNMKIDLPRSTDTFDSGQLVSSVSSPLSENALRQWLDNAEISIKNYQEEIQLLQQLNCRMKEKISAFQIVFDNLQKQKLIRKDLLDVIKQCLMIYETFSQNLESRKCSTAVVKEEKFQPAHSSVLNSNHPKEDKHQHSVCETKIEDNEESYIFPLVVSHQQKEIECRTSSQEQISPIKIENSTQEKVFPANFSKEGSSMKKDLTITINTSDYEQFVPSVSFPLSENSALKKWLENTEITIKNCQEQILVLHQSNCRMKETISAFHALFDNLQKQKLIEKSILDVIKQSLMIYET